MTLFLFTATTMVNMVLFFAIRKRRRRITTLLGLLDMHEKALQQTKDAFYETNCRYRAAADIAEANYEAHWDHVVYQAQLDSPYSIPRMN